MTTTTQTSLTDLSNDALRHIAGNMSLQDRFNLIMSHRKFAASGLAPNVHEILKTLQDRDNPIFMVSYCQKNGWSRYMFKIRNDQYFVIDGDLRYIYLDYKKEIVTEYAKHKGYIYDMDQTQMVQALKQFARVLVSIDASKCSACGPCTASKLVFGNTNPWCNACASLYHSNPAQDRIELALTKVIRLLDLLGAC